MPSFDIASPDSAGDMNQVGSGDEATNLVRSPLKVSKFESKQSSSSKTTSKASSRKGTEYSPETPQEKEKRAVSETPEEKKKRRQEKKAKREQEEKKSGTERALFETTKEKKKRRKERKKKKQKKIEKQEKKEKESKTRSHSVPEATETLSSHLYRKSESVTVGQEANFRQQYKEYQLHRHQTTAPSGSSADKGMVFDTASTNGSTIRNGSNMSDSSVGTCKSSFSTEEMTGKVLDELNLLRHNVKTLSVQLKAANERIRQLDDGNARMSDMAVQLVQTEEQLEYTTEKNKEYSSRVRALEQALILQESELDNAMTVIRQKATRERDLVETGNTAKTSASEEFDEQCSIRKALIASEKADEQCSILQELKAVRGELKQAQQDRDMAIDKATMASVQLAEHKAETDVSRDQWTESHALIEQMRALMWQQGSTKSSTGAIKRGFFWSQSNDSKPGMSSIDDECIDATEDNTSVSSEDLNGWNEMDYHE